jgi:hypothetical protein
MTYKEESVISLSVASREARGADSRMIIRIMTARAGRKFRATNAASEGEDHWATSR